MTKVLVIGVLAIMQARTKENKVVISTPENSIIYKRIGRLFPSLNYGHVRTTVDMSIFPNITQEFAPLPEYSKIS